MMVGSGGNCEGVAAVSMSAGGGTQGDLGSFQSLLSEVAWKKQAPSPTDLYERDES